MTTDPIANFITALQNAAHAGKETVLVHRSALKEAIAETLKKTGYIKETAIKGKKDNKLEVLLTFANGEAKIQGVKRLSRPGKRMYYGVSDIKPIRNGYGHLILSTPEGVITGQDARKRGVGGEALFIIW
jgi:small subunit ribosomal protein S8